MPLLLVATPGAADANSYILAADADTLASYRVGGSAWASLTADQKVQALVTATRALDTVRYRGTRASTTQALEWPRTGTEYGAAEIPASIEAATVELALSYAPAFAAGATSTDVLNPDTARIKEKTIGPITRVFFEPSVPSVEGLDHFPIIVQRLLTPLVRGATVLGYGTSNVVRAS